jgi:hypothetical protein
MTACWADPLSRAERDILARTLARACKRFWDAAAPNALRDRSRVPGEYDGTGLALVEASAEMSALHLDVTERAEVARD